MKQRKSLILGVLFAALSASSLAATLQQTDRITGAITNSPSVALKGDVHPKAQPQYDQGPVEPGMKLGYITMVLQATAAQQADLKQFLQDLQNPRSHSYHKWLTPEQYASRFGVSQNDMQKMQDWLTTQGFEIVQPAHGRNWIAFSGTAELVSQVFQTQIHYYMVDGEKHFSNATNPSIPKALSGMVMGFRGMNNFTPKPMYVARGQNGKANPFYSSGGFNNLAPADIATIYDIQALYNAGITGAGQKIVVVGQTDVSTTDIAAFRSGFGLSATLPTTMLVTTDPGTTGDLGEADLDLEWAGAVAQDASIIYVIGNPTTGNGVFDSAQFAIDNNLAPVISMSYGGCEPSNVTFIPFFETELQKMGALGITFLASSGDSGAAGCDSDQNAQASMGLAVNYPASSPEVTGVGGNEFNEGAGTYWGSNSTNLGSALSYIPEIGWNDTSINGSLASSGGGKSSCGVESGGACTAGFPKPTWQVATGVPADGVRDVPDISMAASADHDGYIFCTNGSCASGIATAVSNNSIVGGTSASAPVFAGIVVLLNDYLVTNGVQSTPGLGNINTKLYQLYATAANAFHDVTSGNNIVPCMSGTTGCPASAPFQYGYSAGVGYDQVTGLGSVDANNLALAFAGNTVTTATVLTTSPSGSVQVGSSAILTLTATVTPSSSTGVPTGTVNFLDNGVTMLGTGTLSAGVATSTPITLNGGNHSLTAVYLGDSSFPGSTSAAVTVLVTLNNPNTTAAISTPNSTTYGNSVMLSATVTATSGTTPPTGTVSFSTGTTVLGTGTLTATGLTTASASFSTSLLPTGSDSVTAAYSGDATYGLSNGVAAVTISKASTTTAATAGNVALGSPATLTATVTPSGSGVAATGSVNFFNGSANIGTATLSNGTASISYSTTGLSAGAVSITTTYQGDTNYNQSTSPVATLNVQNFTLGPASSSVTVTAGQTSQAITLTLTPNATVGFNGVAQLTCTGLPAGAACTFSPSAVTLTGTTSGTTSLTISTTASSGSLIKPGKNSGLFYAMLLPGMLGLVLAGRRKAFKRGTQVLSLIVILGLSTLWMSACGGSSSSGGGGGGGTGTPAGTYPITVLATSGSVAPSVMVSLTVQ